MSDRDKNTIPQQVPDRAAGLLSKFQKKRMVYILLFHAPLGCDFDI
jgi:hypothetical protein